MESGSLTGTLASDGNHFTVTGGTLSYNGANTRSASPVDSFDYETANGAGYNNNNTAVVTLDGAYMDIATGDGTYFAANDVYAAGNGSLAGSGYLGEFEAFDAARLTASVVSAAPEPSSWALMILGFGIAGVALRRRQQVAVRIAYA